MSTGIEGIRNPDGLTGHPPAADRPTSPREAAEQFEHVLIKQMVQTMTKDLFKNGVAGDDDGPQWLGAYADMQGDVLATELANQLTESGRLGIADMLVRQWQRSAESGDAPADDPPSKEILR